MEDLKSAMNEHLDVMSDLIEKVCSEFRSGFQPALDNFIGFFHAIDWKCLVFILLKGSILYLETTGKALQARTILTNMVNTLVSLCQLIIRWKRAELRHQARISQSKQD